MTAIFRNEWKSGLKSLLIWSLAVGGMGLFCIILFQSMEDSMAGMAENFASMGAFSEAFGMSTLSIATLAGFFATEVGTIHSLGSSMFAASLATVVLSKEEDQHTAEFTFALPVSRVRIIIMKYCAVILNLIIFTCICGLLYAIGFTILGESGFDKSFIQFMLFQLLMNIEIASICFVISAVSKKNHLGTGISLAMLFYVYDLMARVIPDLKKTIFLSPFSYANATTIYAGEGIDKAALCLGIGIIICAIAISGAIYTRRDLAS